MLYVMVKQNWPGVFRRCIRDDDDEIVETIEMAPGQVHEFEEDSPQALAIAGDIGKSMIVLAPDDRRILRSPAPVIADAVEITPGGPPSTPTTVVKPAGDPTAKKPSRSEIKQQRKAAAAAATAVKSPAAAAPQQPAYDPTALPPIDDAIDSPEDVE